MRTFSLIAGVVIALLGAFWLLQGLGLVTVKPLLCVADCRPVEGPAPGWSLAGLVALALGIAGIRIGAARRR